MTLKNKRLDASETDYLLWVPYAEKERAKQIEGWRWDATQKCWAFRKSQAAYDAIVSEFGDELANLVEPHHADKSAPAPAPPPVPVGQRGPVIARESASPRAGEQQELIALRHRVQELQGELQLQSALRERAEAEATAARQQTLETHARLIAKESRPDVATLMTQLKNASELVAETQARNVQLNAELSAERQARMALEKDAGDVQMQLMEQIKELEAQAKGKAPVKDLHKRIVNVAIKASGGDGRFAELVGNELVLHGLEVKITAALSSLLLAELRMPAPTNDLYEIINEARIQKLLTHEDAILADTIRRQRNTLAHQDLPKHEVTGRLILILYTAALLWPKLPKHEAAASAPRP